MENCMCCAYGKAIYQWAMVKVCESCNARLNEWPTVDLDGLIPEEREMLTFLQNDGIVVCQMEIYHSYGQFQDMGQMYAVIRALEADADRIIFDMGSQTAKGMSVEAFRKYRFIMRKTLKFKLETMKANFAFKHKTTMEEFSRNRLLVRLGCLALFIGGIALLVFIGGIGAYKATR